MNPIAAVGGPPGGEDPNDGDSQDEDSGESDFEN